MIEVTPITAPSDPLVFIAAVVWMAFFACFFVSRWLMEVYEKMEAGNAFDAIQNKRKRKPHRRLMPIAVIKRKRKLGDVLHQTRHLINRIDARYGFDPDEIDAWIKRKFAADDLRLRAQVLSDAIRDSALTVDEAECALREVGRLMDKR